MPDQTKFFTRKFNVCSPKAGCGTVREAGHYSTTGDVQWTMSKLRKDRDRKFDYYAVALTYRARMYKSCEHLPKHHGCNTGLFSATKLPLALGRNFKQLPGKKFRLLDYAPKDSVHTDHCSEVSFDLSVGVPGAGVSAPIRFLTCDTISRTSSVENPFDRFADIWTGSYNDGERTVSLAVAFKQRHSVGRKTFQVRLRNPFGRKFAFKIGLGSAR